MTGPLADVAVLCHQAPLDGFPATDRNRRSARKEAGSVSAELAVFVAPTLVLLTMFVVFCGRTVSAAIDVHAAAAAGARAAADTATPAAAVQAATNTVAATVAGTSWACTPTIDAAALRPGGQVSVAVACRIPLSDLGLPGVGSRTVHASSTEPIDRYRADP